MDHEVAPREGAAGEGTPEAARARMRRLDPAEAAARWGELLRGRWTIVAKVDEGGRLLVLARPSGEVDAGVSLSYRERQVAQLAARGATIKEIAGALGVASSTAATHLAAAMRKLGVRHRAALVALLG